MRGRETRWTGHESQADILANTVTCVATGILYLGRPTRRKLRKVTHREAAGPSLCEATLQTDESLNQQATVVDLLSRPGLHSYNIHKIPAAFTVGFKFWFANNFEVN